MPAKTEKSPWDAVDEDLRIKRKTQKSDAFMRRLREGKSRILKIRKEGSTDKDIARSIKDNIAEAKDLTMTEIEYGLKTVLDEVDTPAGTQSPSGDDAQPKGGAKAKAGTAARAAVPIADTHGQSVSASSGGGAARTGAASASAAGSSADATGAAEGKNLVGASA